MVTRSKRQFKEDVLIWLILPSVCIILTLYGACVVFIVLIGNFLTDLTEVYSPCIWMAIAAAALTPLTWNECQFSLL